MHFRQAVARGVRAAAVLLTVWAPAAVRADCPATAPRLLTPAGGSAGLASLVTFSWTSVPNATGYKLFASSNSDSTDLLAFTQDTNATRIMPAGTVDWYVETSAPGCTAMRSTLGHFTVAQPACPSGTVTLAAPAAGATVSSPVSFSWSAIPGATAYRIWLSSDGSLPTVVARSADNQQTVPVPGGSADWFVEAIFDNCPSILSGHAQFTVQKAANCGAAQGPTLVSPVSSGNTLTDVDGPVTFSWTPVPNAILYRVLVSDDGLTFEDAGATKDTQLKTTLQPATYTWKVEALFSGCPAAPSAIGSFRVPDTAVICGTDAPTLLSPVNGANAPSPLTFTWTPVSNAAGYRVMASINGGDLALLGTTGGTSLTKTMPAGTVAWMVEAVFKGCPSTRSALGRFTVPRSSSCPAQKAPLVYPLNGDSNVQNPVNFDWDPVAGATGYVVVARGATGASTILGETPVTALQRDVPAGTVEWWVVSLGAGCDPISSDHAKFTVPVPAGCSTVRPKVLTPVDDSTSVVSPVQFSWTPVPGAKAYRLFAAIDGDEPSAVATTTATQVSVPIPTGPVRWSVEAVFDTCPALFSAVSNLTVVDNAAGCDTPGRTAAHVVAQVVSGTPYTLRWTPLTDVSSYQVQESSTLDFSKAATTTVSGVSASFNHTSSGAPALWFYRVRGISACSDQRGAFSRIVATRIVPPDAVGTKSGATAEVGVQTGVTQTVFLPGSLAPASFSATADKPWITVSPSTGTIPPAGLTLTITSDPRGLDVGASRGSVHITYAGTKSLQSVGALGTAPATIPVSVSLVTPVVPQGKNTPLSTSLIIPAVAHAPGSNNSQFLSDIRLANISAQAMKYMINFTATGTDGTQNGTSTTISVDPGSTAALDDILSSFFGTASDGVSAGMLEIRPLTSTSSGAFSGVANTVASVASSRTYNQTALGTFGQFIPAIPFSTFVGQGSVLSLQQIAESTAYRTNFGLVEGAGQPASVVLHVYDKSGTLLKDIPETLLPSEHRQFNQLLKTNGIALDDGRIEVEVVSSTGKVSAYASVVDNGTNDPLLVSPVLKGSVSATRYVIPGVAYTNSSAAWRSDIRLYNSGSAAVDATLTFYPQGSPDKPKAITAKNIAPGEVRSFDNVLNSAFGITDPSAGGSVAVTTQSASSIVATARTYAQATSGTIGQFVPAVTPAASVGAGDRALQLLQVEQSDAFRTNIGLAETTGQPATVEISLVEPDTKVTPVLTWSLAANEFVQIPLSTFNTGHPVYNARVTVKVVSGSGKVTTYASVIDNVSQDPTYVPAQ